MGFFQQLPSGIYTPQATYHNSFHFENKSKMHQTTTKTYGYEFLDSLAHSHKHTDYRFEICSKMFVSSQRDTGGKLFKIISICTYLFVIVFRSDNVFKMFHIVSEFLPTNEEHNFFVPCPVQFKIVGFYAVSTL